jgi:hypothetical protein
VVPLPRLSRVQYDHVVRDLLGVGGNPGRELPDLPANDTKVDLLPWLKATHAAAEEVARKAFGAGGALESTCATTPEAACAESFVRTQGRLLFRRALGPDEVGALMKVWTSSRELGAKDALAQTLVAMLTSAPFLYRVERGGPGRARLAPAEIATRMSFLVWSSAPSPVLLDRAERGELDDGPARAQVLAEMLGDARAARFARDLAAGWLGSRKVLEINKDPDVAKGFTPQVAAALAEETERFAAEVFAAPGSPFADLYTADYSFIDDRLKALYGLASAPKKVERAALPAGQRAGLLTQGAVLAVHANAVEASPVERGVFVFETLLCQARPFVPQDVPPLPAAESGGRVLSQRERLEQHRAAPQCRACHAIFDGYGLALENYDLIGRYTETEGATRLTGQGEVSDLDGRPAKFRGAVELGRLLAASPTARGCFVERVYELTSGLDVSGYDPAGVARVKEAFARSGDMRALLGAIVADESFVTRWF